MSPGRNVAPRLVAEHVWATTGIRAMGAAGDVPVRLPLSFHVVLVGRASSAGGAGAGAGMQLGKGPPLWLVPSDSSSLTGFARWSNSPHTHDEAATIWMCTAHQNPLAGASKAGRDQQGQGWANSECGILLSLLSSRPAHGRRRAARRQATTETGHVGRCRRCCAPPHPAGLQLS